MSLVSLLPGNVFASDFKIGKPFVQTGHSGSVTSVVYSPDNHYILSGSRDKTLKLWEISTGKEIKSFIGHSERVTSVDYSPNGEYVLSGSADKSIKLWNVKTGEVIRTYKGHTEDVNSVAFSPDGKTIASGSYDKTVKFWNLQTGGILYTLKGGSGEVSSIAFSPDGNWLASASWGSSNKDYLVRLWDVHSGNLIRKFTGHSKAVNFVTFSSDGKHILTGSSDKTLRIWDVLTGDVIRTFKGHKGGVKSGAFISNRNQVISTGYDRAVKLWDIQTGKIVQSFVKEKLGWPGSIQIAANSNYAITAEGTDKVIKIWDLTKLKVYRTIKGNAANTRSITLTQDGKKAVFANDNDIAIWDMEKHTFLNRLKGHSRVVMGVAITPDDRFIVSGSVDKTIKIWNIHNGQLMRTIQAHDKPITSIAITPNGKYVLSGAADKLMKLWNISSGELIRIFKGHKSTIWSVDINNGGDRILSASSDKTIQLWNLQNGRKIKTIDKSPYGTMRKVLFTNNYMIAGDQYGMISSFEIKNGQRKQAFKSSVNSNTNALVVSKNNRYLYSGTKVLQKWDISTGQKGFSETAMQTVLNDTFSLALTPDEKFLLSGNANGSISFWMNGIDRSVLKVVTFIDGEWVAITSEGYFTASENGAKYINIQTGSMDVSSIDQYYETFYRPDIVAAALNGTPNHDALVEAPKIKLNEVKPAPAVSIVNTLRSTDKESLKVTIKIIPKSGGVGQIRLYLDGTLIKTDGDRAIRKIHENSIHKSYSIKLPKGTHGLKAIVFNKENTMSSKDATFQVVSTYNPTVKPNIYAIVIGINEYKNPSISLKYAVADAKLFANTIKSNATKLFGNVDIKTLTSKKQTTKVNIINELIKLQNISPNDLFIFYVASHGMVEDTKYHMLTSNVGSLSSRGIKREAIIQDDLKEMIANIPTSKKIIILDTCNSGALGQALEVELLTRGLNETTAMKVLSRAVGSTIISASSSTQEALEGYKGHGLDICSC